MFSLWEREADSSLIYLIGMVHLHFPPLDMHFEIDCRILLRILHPGLGIPPSRDWIPSPGCIGRTKPTNHQGRWCFRSSCSFRSLVQCLGWYCRFFQQVWTTSLFWLWDLFFTDLHSSIVSSSFQSPISPGPRVIVLPLVLARLNMRHKFEVVWNTRAFAYWDKIWSNIEVIVFWRRRSGIPPWRRANYSAYVLF